MGRGPKIWIIPEVKIDLEILDKKREWEEIGMVKYNVNKYIQKHFNARTHTSILMDLKTQEQGLQE